MAITNTTFEDFLLNNPAQIDFPSFILSLILSALLAYLLGKLYIRYGTSISNRRKFANNFVIITATTTLIISVVKSSLALSLGLVGALSIVRFRAAIKEPEELAFLFLAIALGLGFGANQIPITVTAFVVISLIIYGSHFLHKKEENSNLYLTISGKISKDVTLRKIVDILKKYSSSVHLKRFDKTDDDSLEASFLVDLSSFDNLERIKESLENLSKSIKISYLDKVGIYH